MKWSQIMKRPNIKTLRKGKNIGNQSREFNLKHNPTKFFPFNLYEFCQFFSNI